MRYSASLKSAACSFAGARQTAPPHRLHWSSLCKVRVCVGTCAMLYTMGIVHQQPWKKHAAFAQKVVFISHVTSNPSAEHSLVEVKDEGKYIKCCQPCG
ncbi:hypothetical protein FKM82_005087 [Ascaphus truei]